MGDTALDPNAAIILQESGVMPHFQLGHHRQLCQRGYICPGLVNPSFFRWRERRSSDRRVVEVCDVIELRLKGGGGL